MEGTCNAFLTNKMYDLSSYGQLYFNAAPNSRELVGELEGHMLCHCLYCNESTSVLSDESLKG
eukprot:10790615-Ditylum_brightwellii.AAC.1